MTGGALGAYLERGGQLHCPEGVLEERIRHIRLLLFDWDGVFNNGHKITGNSSSFSEVDSMGSNLLRYGLYKLHQEMPRAYILSGASNPVAKDFAERERFHGALLNFKDKNAAIDRILEEEQLDIHEVAFFFDDILDLGVAARAGFRVFLGGDHSPSLQQFVRNNELADYSTARPGGHNGLREACDFMLEAVGVYQQVVTDRLGFTQDYQGYWTARQSITTRFEHA